MLVSDILAVKLEALHSDVGEVKTALGKLSDAITKLALVEQQQTQTALALERAFKTISKIEDRVAAIEQQQAAVLPKNSETAKWVDRAIVALVSASAVLVGKSVGFG